MDERYGLSLVELSLEELEEQELFELPERELLTSASIAIGASLCLSANVSVSVSTGSCGGGCQ